MKGKIGLELEAGTLYEKELQQIAKEERIIKLTTDGSVRTTGNNLNAEILFNPVSFSRVKLLKERIKRISKFVSEINNTMGFHIHISFKNYSDYVKLLDYNFAKEFQEAYKNTFKLVKEQKRLNNGYCYPYNNKASFIRNATIQLNSFYKNDRNFVVNYNAYNVHNTIEFRVFPTADAEKLCEYIDFTLSFVEKWLKSKEKEENNLSIDRRAIPKRVRAIKKIEKEDFIV